MNGEIDKAFEQALRFLKYSDRTVHEMKDKLREKNFSEEAVDAAVGKLKKIGLLDDRKLAERWIRSRLSSRPIGRKLIQQQLRLKGIHPELILEVIEPIYSEFVMSEKIEELVRRQIAKHKSLDRFEQKKKIFAFLFRRGFDYEECASAVEHLISGSEED